MPFDNSCVILDQHTGTDLTTIIAELQARIEAHFPGKARSFSQLMWLSGNIKEGLPGAHERSQKMKKARMGNKQHDANTPGASAAT